MASLFYPHPSSPKFDELLSYLGEVSRSDGGGRLNLITTVLEPDKSNLIS